MYLQAGRFLIDVYLHGIVIGIRMRYRIGKVAKDTFWLIRTIGMVARSSGCAAVRTVVQRACGRIGDLIWQKISLIVGPNDLKEKRFGEAIVTSYEKDN